jgi:hypothetical protein
MTRRRKRTRLKTILHKVGGNKSELGTRIFLFKGQCHEIFHFRFFYDSVSPKPLSIPLIPLRPFNTLADIKSDSSKVILIPNE